MTTGMTADDCRILMELAAICIEDQPSLRTATADEVTGKTMSELKDMLRTRALSMSGRKADLVARVTHVVPDQRAVQLYMYRIIYKRCCGDIREYGETGFGDKPDELSTWVYWAQHNEIATYRRLAAGVATSSR